MHPGARHRVVDRQTPTCTGKPARRIVKNQPAARVAAHILPTTLLAALDLRDPQVPRPLDAPPHDGSPENGTGEIVKRESRTAPVLLGQRDRPAQARLDMGQVCLGIGEPDPAAVTAGPQSAGQRGLVVGEMKMGGPGRCGNCDSGKRRCVQNPSPSLHNVPAHRAQDSIKQRGLYPSTSSFSAVVLDTRRHLVRLALGDRMSANSPTRHVRRVQRPVDSRPRLLPAPAADLQHQPPLVEAHRLDARRSLFETGVATRMGPPVPHGCSTSGSRRTASTSP